MDVGYRNPQAPGVGVKSVTAILENSLVALSQTEPVCWAHTFQKTLLESTKRHVLDPCSQHCLLGSVVVILQVSILGNG